LPLCCRAARFWIANRLPAASIYPATCAVFRRVWLHLNVSRRCDLQLRPPCRRLHDGVVITGTHVDLDPVRRSPPADTGRRSQVVDAQQLSPGGSSAAIRHLRRAGRPGLVVPTDECPAADENRMRRSCHVTRSVQVRRHGEDPRQTVLAPDGLNLQDAGDLGNGVGIVGRLQRPGEQRAFPDRLRLCFG